MKLLCVVCVPKRPSLGASLAAGLRRAFEESGQELAFHDLYEEGFDPLLSPGELQRGLSLDGLVQTHARDLEEAGGLVIIHPDWWGQPPAILKGWIDRVLRRGLAYELAGEEGGELAWTPLLRGKKALVIVTTDAADPRRPEFLRELWAEAVLGACGVETRVLVLSDLRGRGPGEGHRLVSDALALAAAIFPAPRGPAAPGV